ncbi:MAG: leucine-rich repeat domain-containing protein [Alistipes sp.]|nr:leucine-rich repeat domain-containing protein [Alistipes sp.]
MNIVQLNTVNLGDNIIVKGEGGSSSGGGGSTPSKTVSDVTFYDCDGTVLYGYTKEGFLKLANMPALPERKGLICQGWNWDLADAVDYVSKYGMLNVGATYITDDGKSRFYVRMRGFLNMQLRISQSIPYGAVINWGDGNEETTGENLNWSYNHTYANEGDYIITLQPINGCIWGMYFSYRDTFFGSYDPPKNPQKVYKVELGEGIETIGKLMFSYYCYNLATLTIPNGVSRINGEGVSAYGLKCLILPKTVTVWGYKESNSNGLSIGNGTVVCLPHGLQSELDTPSLLIDGVCESVFLPQSLGAPVTLQNGVCKRVVAKGVTVNNGGSLIHGTLLEGVTSIGSSAFSNCYSLASINIPEGVTNIGSSAFSNCRSLASINIPEGVTNIESSAFSNCRSLASINIPEGVTNIESSAFSNCSGVAFFDFSNHSTIPTLGSATVFSTTYGKIIVPDALYDEWIVATNWATYASQIIKKSEWDAQQTA